MPVEPVYGLSSLEVDWFLGAHLFIQFFIHSFNEYEFSTFHILDTVLGTEYSTMNKTGICPLLSLSLVWYCYMLEEFHLSGVVHCLLYKGNEGEFPPWEWAQMQYHYNNPLLTDT